MTTPADSLLVFNAGSSSLKFELFTAGRVLESVARGVVADIGRERSAVSVNGPGVEGNGQERTAAIADAGAAADFVLDGLAEGRFGPPPAGGRQPVTVHRIVHGGATFREPARVTPAVVHHLRELRALAPLHIPHALEVMDAVRERYADAEIIAVFDTAFFRDLPEHARAYAVPQAWRTQLGIERYGFHGIAHEYLGTRLMALSRRRPRRAITLHLGQGCSATALEWGVPVDTSMGYTPLEGLVMGTRCGDIDAGVLIHLARQGMSWSSLENALNRESGLLGLSGASDDMRELLRLEEQGDPDAQAALAVFLYRIRKYLGAYAAVLGGVDAIAIGGGIGENSPDIRARVCRALKWLGLELDPSANEAVSAAETLISTTASPIEAWCIPVREERLMAEAAVACRGREKQASGGDSHRADAASAGSS